MGFDSPGPVAALAAVTLAPLAATCLPDLPLAFGAGCALAAALVRLTLSGDASSPPDPTLEAAAAARVVTTSRGNRAVRLGLGAVYWYAAISFAQRLAAPRAAAPPALGRAVGAWAGCFADLTIGGLWVSSGADGQ